MIALALLWFALDIALGMFVGSCIRFGMGETNG